MTTALLIVGGIYSIVFAAVLYAIDRYTRKKYLKTDEEIQREVAEMLRKRTEEDRDRR